MTAVSKICDKAGVEQFPDDFYAEDNILFCKFCLHSVDIFRVDTIIDHIKSEVHMRKKIFNRVISSETEDNNNIVKE